MKKTSQFIFMFIISIGTFVGYAPSLAEQWQTQGLPEQLLPTIHSFSTKLPWNETWKNWKINLQKTESFFYESSNENKKNIFTIENNVNIIGQNIFSTKQNFTINDTYLPILPTPYPLPTNPILPIEKNKFGRSDGLSDNLSPPQNNAPPNTILLVGDSMAGSLEYGLKKILRNTKIINKHRHSTGLTVKSYYDWPEQLKEINSEESGDFIISMTGANDAQSIFFKNKYYNISSKEWIEAYTERAMEWKKSLDNTGKPYIVLGMPDMRDDYFNKRMQIINAIIEPLFGDHFLNLSKQLLDKKGQYNGDLRASDGIHFSGGAINKVTELIVKKEKWINNTNTIENKK